MEKKLPNQRPLVKGNVSRDQVNNDILNCVKGKQSFWIISFGVSSLIFLAGLFCLLRVWWSGIGMWGENRSVNWAWDITNFVWWIGIGHAGTLISAILLLFRAKWRNSVNRMAEAMTLCAVLCAAFFILAHLGRPWLFYWIFPIPNTYDNLWINFNSALIWDAFAVLVYLIISILFWYYGMIPDLAILRERNHGWKKKLNTMFSLNWDFSVYNWRRYEEVLHTLAGLATALVISVHSIVAMDFATTVLDGWHSTIFPPYFVIGAIFSGLAMVLTIVVPVRKFFGLQNYITKRHLENINLLIIVTSGLIGVSYMTELVAGFYMDKTEGFMIRYRLAGDYSIFFYIMMLCNVLLPQLLWWKKIRQNFAISFVLSIFINIGMWIERFVIIVSSLSRDRLPSSWMLFFPSLYDVGVFVFSWGLFLLLLLLFLRFIPIMSMSEVKPTIRSPGNA